MSERLFTFKSGGWVLLLAGLMTLGAAALVLYPVYAAGGFHQMIGDGRNVETYRFDLSNLMIAREKLVASGNSKDQIRAIPQNLVETITPGEADLIATNEHIRFLVPSDRVVGLVIGGVARAYPVRVLALHELVNDLVGDVPVAVSYSPLSDSVVVWDRRIEGGGAREFGVSGLLVDSNTVYFDRQEDGKAESLWPQLALKAVAGPAAGKHMPLVRYEMTTWGTWRADHPDTRVLLGLRTLKREYGSDPFSMYFANDDLRFPASPEWSGKVGKKTPVVVSSKDGQHWVARAPGTPASPTTAAGTTAAEPARTKEIEIYTFIFAWYAQHPSDTDYSALR